MMQLIEEQDRFYLENKYHRTDEPFNPYFRRAYHGIGYAPETGKSEEEILAGLRELEPELAGLAHPVARARAIAYVLQNERLYPAEHDWFVGLDSLDRLADSVTKTPWEAQANEKRDPELFRLSELFNRAGAVDNWVDYDHVVPDWESLLSLGFGGIRERAASYRRAREQAGELTDAQAAFFEGIDLEYAAVLGLLERLYRFALSQPGERAQRQARCLRALCDGAPTDTYEALQLMLIYFLVSESVDGFQVRSLGNGLDRSLRRFWEGDLRAGRYSREQLRQFLAYFLMQWSAIGNYWGQPFYLGGTNPDGTTRCCGLTDEILDVYDRLEIYNPKIQLKVAANMPKKTLHKALAMVRRKNAAINFCCEPGMVRAVMSYGATEEEALDMDLRGCYETGVRANEAVLADAYVNAAKAVEYAFSNGFDRRLGEQVGPRTGELAEFSCFADFYRAFLAQWRYLIETAMAITRDADRFLSFVNPSSLYSGTVEHSLRCGRDAYENGLKFNNTAILCCAFASAVDSLLAVKEFVFEKEVVSLPELDRVLCADWQGYEALRAAIRKSECKYGNGNAQADRLAAAMAHFFTALVDLKPNGRGGVYKAILHSARMFLNQGKMTGALPDGRKSGEELSKNATAVIGADRQGPTALIRSAAALHPSDFCEAFNLDLVLHPSAVAGEEGLLVMEGLLMTYLELGGMSLQFNLLDSAALRDAQKHPERYASLQVRVCGWNVLWNDLTKEEQDAYLARSEAAAE